MGCLILISDLFYNVTGHIAMRFGFWLTPSPGGALPPCLLFCIQRLSSRDDTSSLAIQIHARRVLRHAHPVPISPAPGSEAQFELFGGYAEQLEVLLGILEDALLQRNLRTRIDRKCQWKMLLQSPDRFHRWILLPRLRLHGRRPLGLLRAIGLWLFFSPQAVTQLS